MGFSRNSDPDASAYFARRPDCVAKPQLTGGTQVKAVMQEVDRHGLSQPPWTSREVDHRSLAAVKLHEMNSIERLKSAYQYSCPNPSNFTADVGQEVKTISSINIRVPMIEE